jgi:hypothetical protein
MKRKPVNLFLTLLLVVISNQLVSQPTDELRKREFWEIPKFEQLPMTPDGLVDIDTVKVINFADPEMIHVDVNMSTFMLYKRTNKSELLYYALLKDSTGAYYSDRAKIRHIRLDNSLDTVHTWDMAPLSVPLIFPDIDTVPGNSDIFLDGYYLDGLFGYDHIFPIIPSDFNIIYSGNLTYDIGMKLNNKDWSRVEEYDILPKSGRRRGVSFSDSRSYRLLPNTLRLLSAPIASIPVNDYHSRPYFGFTPYRGWSWYNSRPDFLRSWENHRVNTFISEYGYDIWTNTYRYTRYKEMDTIDTQGPVARSLHYNGRYMASSSGHTINWRWIKQSNTVIDTAYFYDSEGAFYEVDRADYDSDEYWTTMTYSSQFSIGSEDKNLYTYPFRISKMLPVVPDKYSAVEMYISYERKDIPEKGNVLRTDSDNMGHGAGVGKFFDVFDRFITWGGFTRYDWNDPPHWTWEFDGEGNEHVADMATDSSGNVAVLIHEEGYGDLPSSQPDLSGGRNRGDDLRLVRIDRNGRLLTSVKIMDNVAGAWTGKRARLQYLNDTLYVFAIAPDLKPTMLGGRMIGEGVDMATYAVFTDAYVRSEVETNPLVCSWDDINVKVDRTTTFEKEGYHSFQVSTDSLFDRFETIYEGKGKVPEVLPIKGAISLPPGEYYHRITMDGHISEISDSTFSLGNMPWLNIKEQNLALCSGIKGYITVETAGTDGTIVDGNGLEINSLGNGIYEISADNDGSYTVWARANSGVCQVTDSIIVEVMQEIQITAPTEIDICGTDMPATLYGAMDIFPAGGRFEIISGYGVDSLGTLSDSISNEVMVSYTVESGAGCSASKTITATINKVDEPVIEYDRDKLIASNYPDAGQQLEWQIRQAGVWETLTKGSFYVPTAIALYRCRLTDDGKGCASPYSEEYYLDSLYRNPDTSIEINPEKSMISARYDRGALTIQAPSTIGIYTVHDMTGKTMISGQLGSMNAQVYVNLPTGTYFLTSEELGSVIFRVK